jgi:tRNA modification GTPase
MPDADLVIVILDGSSDLSREDYKILSLVDDLNHLVVINKVDLVQTDINLITGTEPIYISAKTGAGLDNLKNFIIEPFNLKEIEDSGFLVSDARHNDLLLRSKDEIESSIILLNQNMSEEIILIGLHNSLRYLGQITGETTTEDMLTRIFSTFCIGK